MVYNKEQNKYSFTEEQYAFLSKAVDMVGLSLDRYNHSILDHKGWFGIGRKKNPEIVATTKYNPSSSDKQIVVSPTNGKRKAQIEYINKLMRVLES